MVLIEFYFYTFSLPFLCAVLLFLLLYFCTLFCFCSFFHFWIYIGKFRREFLSVLERCRCSNRDLYRHHSCYFNTPGARLNTISPNTRSLCQFASHRDRNKSFREKHVSFLENFESKCWNRNNITQKNKSKN